MCTSVMHVSRHSRIGGFRGILKVIEKKYEKKCIRQGEVENFLPTHSVSAPQDNRGCNRRILSSQER